MVKGKMPLKEVSYLLAAFILASIKKFPAR